MEKKKYFVSKNGQQLGPFSLDDLYCQLDIGDIHETDYIYDPEKADWFLILNFINVAMHAKKHGMREKTNLPQLESLPKEGEENGSTSDKDSGKFDKKDSAWYILKGNDRFGPFLFTDVVNMLQEQSVVKFDFVWNSSLETWKRVAELKEFSRNSLRRLRNISNSDIHNVFFKRKHYRAKYGSTVLIHNNKRVWKAQGVNISSTGARVKMFSSLLEIGQPLYLHFKAGGVVPPFKARCKIINKKAETDKNSHIPCFFYGLKFTSVDKDIEKAHQGGKEKVAYW